MSNTTGPKINVVDSIPDGAVYGSDGRAFLRMWQALIQPNVLSMVVSAAPVSPVNGDMYVVASVGSGAWVGKTNYVAYWSTDNPSAPSGEWEFYQPLSGWVVSDRNTGFSYKYNGSTWVQLPIGVTSLNSGTGASSATFWRGDGTWAAAGATAFSTSGQGWLVPDIGIVGTVNGSAGQFTPANNDNEVLVYQIVVLATYTFRKISALPNSAGGAGNASCAIYSFDGNTKIVDAGSNAFPGGAGGALVTVSITPVVLSPGVYWLACSATNHLLTSAAAFTLSSGAAGMFTLANSSQTRVGKAANNMSAGAMPTTLGAISSISDPGSGFARFLFEC